MSGMQLKRLRLLHNYTQKDLAKKIGVSRQALCMWESNKREIKVVFLRKIAKTFNVSVDEIINSNKFLISKKEREKMKGKIKASSKTVKGETLLKKISKIKKAVSSSKVKIKNKKSKKIQLKLKAPNANNVFVLGDFNGWDTSGVKMEKSKRGTWKANISLEPGRYEYKFIVDNEWWTDPENSNVVWNNLGSQNSFFDLN